MENKINPNLIGFDQYQPGKSIEEIKRKFKLEKIIKLASNENPFPLPKNVVNAIKDEICLANRYPDSDCFNLTERIADYNEINNENILVGAGLGEIIRIIIQTFLKPGEKVLGSEKSFLYYKTATVKYAGKHAFVEAKMGDDFRYDLDRIYQLLDERIKIIFIANPNNPTGTMIPKNKFIDFINKTPEDKIIVLDNAYQEYIINTDEYLDGIELALNRKNVIVLRTFSKIYALAGLRIGYAISNEKVISYLSRTKAPFNVNRIAQSAALASLGNDDFKNESARLNSKNKEKLVNQLDEMGLRVIPSVTNFLLFFPGTDIVDINDKLLKEGVVIRPLQAFGIPDGMRVTVGCEEDNNFFLKKLKKILTDLG